MNEPTLSEVLRDMKERLKEAAETKERLERVIEGLESIYSKNAKESRRAMPTIPTETTQGVSVGDYAKQLSTSIPVKRSERTKALLPEIEKRLLAGVSPAKIAEELRIKAGPVYTVKYRLRKEKKLK